MRGKRPVFFAMAVLPLIMMLFPSLSGAEETDCLTCHPDLKERKVVHAAVDMGCAVCHTGVDAGDIPHKFSSRPKGLSSGQPDICYGCHDSSVFRKKHPHAALQMGCTSCHDPHSSAVRKLLTAQLPELCFNCHDKGKFVKKSIHTPVAGGMCTSCHSPHSSDGEKLLPAGEPGLCYGCHDRGAFTQSSVHAPVMGGMCSSCHDPHSSNADGRMLLKNTPDLCFMCHDGKAFAGKKVVHSPVGAGMCTSCHSPHSSGAAKMLKSDIPGLCRDCHTLRERKRERSHGPVEIGMCLFCHEPHQGDREKLLVKPASDLCFDCHRKGGFSRKNVHVPVAGGMCLQCHEVHFARYNNLLSKKGNGVCLDCHPQVPESPHPVSGMSEDGHPLRGRWGKWDPRNKNRPFGCVSCHDPHSSDWGKLFRYKANDAFDLCRKCHKDLRI